MAIVAAPGRLHETAGYTVQSAAGTIGRVEEVWLGPEGDPQALAVRTSDGDDALLLAGDVVAVDAEHRWVVVGEHPDLLELAPPRLQTHLGGRLAASWETTGAVVHPQPRGRFAFLGKAERGPAPTSPERPLWQLVGILYGAITLIVVAVLALSFLVAWIVGGAPY
jgi:hypothetical protein